MGKCENAKIIKLRKLEPSDLPFLYQWENDASVWADGSNHNPLSQLDLRDYIESTTGDIYKDADTALYAVKQRGRNGIAFHGDGDTKN